MSGSADPQTHEITGSVSFPLFCEPATEATVMFHSIKTSDFSGDGWRFAVKQGMKEPASCIHIKAGLKR